MMSLTGRDVTIARIGICCFLITGGLLASFVLANRLPVGKTNGGGQPVLELNETLIEAWRRPVDWSDTNALFAMILSQIGSEARVYPSENFYYFRLDAGGRTIGGNIQLDARDRDRGVVHFTWYEIRGDREPANSFVTTPYDATRGVKVHKLSELLYSVEFRRRKVLFRLNKLDLSPPEQNRLAPSESFVGPVLDESGITFLLIFDNITAHFMYILDERAISTERMSLFRDSLLMGDRTGFVFFDDAKFSRKILVGVLEANRIANNYYDGPFDQMPDNHVNELSLQKYLRLAYPSSRDATDRYGSLLDDPETRIAIAPYVGYRDQTDFDFIGACSRRESESEFYKCLTPDPRQQSPDNP